MYNSIPIDMSIELINVKPLNPLISKCQIKVCYVGDEPNRNRSIITKETAYDLANSLPGSPIVGYYNEEEQDFEEHNRALEIKDGKIFLRDITRPYGFVDLNAKVWFQKFLDNGVEHEYLVTEGYLWTGQYPEARRVIEKGNNQSMELDEKNIDAYWTKDKNGKQQFFIINEAIISKLCILGEKEEPCFEGASIHKVQFSFEDGFKEQLFSMMNEIKNILEKGGTSMDLDNMTTEVVETPVDEEVTETPAEETVVEETSIVVEAPEVPVEEPVVETPVEEPAAEEPASQEEVVAYNLEEIPEYVELNTKYASLVQDYDSIMAEVTSLREFKRQIERKDKEAMIAQFYMLSDEDKKDVRENIDNYSIDDIEAKLSVICVRNKVKFDLDEEEKVIEEPITYNLNSEVIEDSVPAWIKAVKQTVAKK